MLQAMFCCHAHGAPGDVDLSFDPGSGIDRQVNVVAVQADGKVIVAGEFSTVKGLVRPSLARLNSDGSGDPSFDAGGLADSVRDGNRIAAGREGSDRSRFLQPQPTPGRQQRPPAQQRRNFGRQFRFRHGRVPRWPRHLLHGVAAGRQDRGRRLLHRPLCGRRCRSIIFGARCWSASTPTVRRMRASPMATECTGGQSDRWHCSRTARSSSRRPDWPRR